MSPHLVRLGQIAEFVRGVTYKPGDVTSAEDPKAIPCLRTKNIQEYLEDGDLVYIPRQAIKPSKIVREGDILVSSANSWNLVGKCSWIPSLKYDATFGGFTSVLRGNESVVFRRYLYHWFSSPTVQQLARSFGNQTTNISNLNQARCLELKIPLPPLDEQKRIAAILDKADALRAKRRQAIALLDSLTQSIFLEMFGDPVSNPKGWDVTKLGDLFNLKHGFAFKSENFVSKGPYILLTPGNFFEEGGFRQRGEKQRYHCRPVPHEYILEESDILVAMTEQAPGLLGSPLIVPEGGKYLHNQRLGKVVKNTDVDTHFIFGLLNIASVRARIQADSSGTKVKHTSPTKIADIIIGYPPHRLQTQYAIRVEAAWQQKSLLTQALLKQDNLFKSLQHRAFSGQP